MSNNPISVTITLKRRARAIGKEELSRFLSELALAYPELYPGERGLFKRTCELCLYPDVGITVSFTGSLLSDIYDPAKRTLFEKYHIADIAKAVRCNLVVEYERSERLDCEKIRVNSRGRVTSVMRLGYSRIESNRRRGNSK